MKRFVTWGGATVIGIAGAAAAFFLDPKKGANRRHAAVERGATMVRRERANVSTMIAGKKKSGSPPKPKASAVPSDDVVAGLIRNEIRSIHGEDVARGVGVRVMRGRVTLRGEVDDLELIGTVARTASAVDGVADVNNLLRLGIYN